LRSDCSLVLSTPTCIAIEAACMQSSCSGLASHPPAGMLSWTQRGSQHASPVGCSTPCMRCKSVQRTI
jgi:hypothetical protein